MRIIDDTKLDFKDVLFVPKRSTLRSRKDVDLSRTYKFKHSQQEYTGIPIMASNMDGVGTPAMAQALYEQRMFTCLVKTLDLKEYHDLSDAIGGNYFAVSTGYHENDNKLKI